MSESLTKKLSDGIIDAVNIICQDLPFAKIYRGKIEELLDNNYFTTNVNGKSYDLPVYGDYVFSVGEIVQVVIPLNNFSTAFILPKNGSGGGGETGVQSVNGKTGVVTLTKADLGLSNVENKSAEQILSELTASDIVTILGYTPSNNVDLNSHINNKNNPHVVTKAQVGLSNVDDIKQYSADNPPPYPVTSVNGQTGDIQVSVDNVSNSTATFTQAVVRENINSQETISTIFGKIKKWFSDLKTIAFTGAFSDLTSHPNTLNGYGITDGAKQSDLNTLSGRVSTNEDNIAMAESDIEGLQTDVGTLKTDNTALKTAVTTLQNTYVPNTTKVNNKALSSDITLNADDVGALPNQAATTDNLGGIKVGAGLSVTTDGTLSATGGGVADAVEWDNVLNTPTTLAGYGISDANINNGTINLGASSITPLTEIPIASNNIGGVKNGGNVTISEDGTMNTSVKKNVWYGTCPITVAAAKIKPVTTDSGDFKLESGNIVVVYFVAAAGNNTLSLNIDETGDVEVYTSGTGTSLESFPQWGWKANTVVSFVYDGTYFRPTSISSKANSVYYGLTKLSSATNSTSTAVAATPSAVKKAYDLANTANTGLANKQNKVTYGTDDLTAGTSELADGELYFVYE